MIIDRRNNLWKKMAKGVGIKPDTENLSGTIHSDLIRSGQLSDDFRPMTCSL